MEPTLFLSVDIDFWHLPGPAESTLSSLVKFVRDRGIPLTVVMNHQQMLRQVNASPARILVNLDEHSDLVDRDVTDLTCGTWVSYVRWRAAGAYLWARNRHRVNTGNCNRDLSPRWNYGSDWALSKSYCAPQEGPLQPFLNDRLVGVGVCLSPSYTRIAVLPVARKVLSGFPYVRGRFDDDSFVRSCRPPRPLAA